jgi:divalent metal cation (Fe/Co/Zn/Cd) transporter
MSTAKAHAIASEVERRLQNQIPQVVDALVHIEPARIDNANGWKRLSNSVRKIADGLGLGTHDLHMHINAKGEYSLELHLEIPGQPTLGEAHQLAEQFEQRVQQYWPQAVEIITHLEPLQESFLLPSEIPDAEMEHQIRNVLAKYTTLENIYSVQNRCLDGHYSTAICVRQPSETPLTEAHLLAEAIERDLLAAIPSLKRVTVHVEPVMGIG